MDTIKSLALHSDIIRAVVTNHRMWQSYNQAQDLVT